MLSYFTTAISSHPRSSQISVSGNSSLTLIIYIQVNQATKVNLIQTKPSQNLGSRTVLTTFRFCSTSWIIDENRFIFKVTTKLCSRMLFNRCCYFTSIRQKLNLCLKTVTGASHPNANLTIYFVTKSYHYIQVIVCKACFDLRQPLTILICDYVNNIDFHRHY